MCVTIPKYSSRVNATNKCLLVFRHDDLRVRNRTHRTQPLGETIVRELVCWLVELLRSCWASWFIDWLVVRAAFLMVARALRQLVFGIAAGSGRPDQHYNSRGRARPTG